MSRNRVIGRNNDLPWRLPDDLRYFKALTLGKPVVMGRKTYESIGRPLPRRTNIVLTRDPDYQAPGCQVCASLEEALRLVSAEPEVMIIGGAAIYQMALARADRIYLTEVHADLDGDTWFPELDPTRWQQVVREDHHADDRHAFDYSFVTLDRITPD
jgi:dihydrofolate reductase